MNKPGTAPKRAHLHRELRTGQPEAAAEDQDVAAGGRQVDVIAGLAAVGLGGGEVGEHVAQRASEVGVGGEDEAQAAAQGGVVEVVVEAQGEAPELVGLGVLAQDRGQEVVIDHVRVGRDVGVAVLDRQADLAGVDQLV